MHSKSPYHKTRKQHTTPTTAAPNYSVSAAPKLNSRLDHEKLVRQTELHLLLDDLEPGLGEYLEPLAVRPGVSPSQSS